MDQITSVFDKNYLVCNKCKVFITFEQESEKPLDLIEPLRELLKKYLIFPGKEINL